MLLKEEILQMPFLPVMVDQKFQATLLLASKWGRRIKKSCVKLEKCLFTARSLWAGGMYHKNENLSQLPISYNCVHRIGIISPKYIS